MFFYEGCVKTGTLHKNLRWKKEGVVRHIHQAELRGKITARTRKVIFSWEKNQGAKGGGKIPNGGDRI